MRYGCTYGLRYGLRYAQRQTVWKDRFRGHVPPRAFS